MKTFVFADEDDTLGFALVTELNLMREVAFAKYEVDYRSLKVSIDGDENCIDPCLSKIIEKILSIKHVMPQGVIQDTDETFVVRLPFEQHIINGIRRCAISEVETMAIDRIDIIKQSSALNDMVLVHVLGLIPVLVDPAPFQYLEHCVCDSGCPSCSMTLELDVNEPRLVTSSDLVGGPVTPDMPIVTLREGEHLHIRCLVLKGKGKTHTKWNPTCKCTFTPEVHVAVTDLDVDLVSVCPRGVFAKDHSGIVRVVNADKCSMCMLCKQDVRASTKECVFKVTSVGQLAARRIFEDALTQFHLKIVNAKYQASGLL